MRDERKIDEESKTLMRGKDCSWGSEVKRGK
jgi:hypothetical protein